MQNRGKWKSQVVRASGVLFGQRRVRSGVRLGEPRDEGVGPAPLLVDAYSGHAGVLAASHQMRPAGQREAGGRIAR